MKKQKLSRRSFVQLAGAGVAWGVANAVTADGLKTIPGFEAEPVDLNASKGWVPVSDRKIRIGIAGYGVCRFGGAFGFQDHPNVEVVAVTDLIPERCAALAKACRCKKTYRSCEAMNRDDTIEAVFVATDAPSHSRLSIDALNHGKHVACAVPAVFGSMKDASRLFAAVKKSGLKYMMFETSYYHAPLYAWRQQYNAGALGKVVYSEAEYYHYCGTPFPSYKGWRVGAPPQWYSTHTNAYYTGVTGGRFTEVSCMGMPSTVSHLQPANNPYRNSFGTEVALFRTHEGGMSRMVVSWDTPGPGGMTGRVRGQKEGRPSVKTNRPPLPPGVSAGGHGGSHGYLMSEFVESILQNRTPLVDVAQSLNMTVSGIVAHQSALKGGALMRIPQYVL